MAHRKQGFHQPLTHSSPPQGSPHLGLCSRVLQEKKPWPDSSPSCGRPSSAAAVVFPAFYCSTTMMKESKSRDAGLSKRISCGTLSKRIFLQAGDSFFFFSKMKAPSPCFPTFLKISGQATQPVVSKFSDQGLNPSASKYSALEARSLHNQTAKEVSGRFQFGTAYYNLYKR